MKQWKKTRAHIYFIGNSWMCVIYQKNNGTFDRFIVEVFLATEKKQHTGRKKTFIFYMHNKQGGKEKRQLQKTVLYINYYFSKVKDCDRDERCGCGWGCRWL